ncbi:WD40 repeat-like protein [Favolaschia claudopus]|uniref:WD40 repeat-like protein n=1 Tax=Favolaschia claudopus TaxID=2862362 RepID=A0AAV9ZX65_9AGAR
MAQNYSLLLQSADLILWNSFRDPKLYLTADVDDTFVIKTPVSKRSLKPEWNVRVKLLSHPLTSIITLRLYCSTRFPGRSDPCLGECKITIQDVFHRCSSDKALELQLEAKGEVCGRVSVLLESIGAAALSAVDELQKKIRRLGTNEIDADVSGLVHVAREWASAISGCVEMGGEIAKVHPYATAAWKILTALYQAIEMQRGLDAEVVEMVKTMVEVDAFIGDVGFLSHKIKPLEDALVHIAEQTIECANFLDQYSRDGFSGRAIRNTFLKNNKKKIQEICTELTMLKASFDRGVAIQSATGVNRLDQSVLLAKLRHLPYDASLRTECLAGTRTDVLEDIIRQLNAPSDNSNILWLFGVAGSGKSTIATSISHHFRRLQRLGAFVFFHRNDLDSSNPTTVLHSIAYKMAQLNRQIRDALCGAIDRQPEIINAPIAIQFQELLLGPFHSAQLTEPIIIVLDALDECSNTFWRSSLITLIANDFTKLPSDFRIVVTSRPDADIKGPFGSNTSITRWILDISTRRNTEDITSYVRHSLEDIRTKEDRIPRTWPGEPAIAQLAERSGGLFIWASLACAFIGSFDPRAKLKTLLSQSFNQETRLDDLYDVALRTAPWTDPDFAPSALAVLACIILSSAPHTAGAMDSLLALEIGTSSSILEHLGCIIRLASDQTARVLHGSFADYLTNPGRSGGCHWHINRDSQNLALALHCFRILQNQLHFNMCSIQDSNLLNSEISDLHSRIQNIQPELRYVGRYWGTHLRDATPDNKVILAKLKNFVESQFLSWLELLSLMGLVQRAGDILEVAQDYIKSDQNLKVSLHDARRFVNGFAPVIAQSTAHIYISALPFAPKQSLVQQNFASKFPGVLTYTDPGNIQWASLQKTLLGHTSDIVSVAFSPDGTRICSCSWDKTVRIWDSETGATLGVPLAGHTRGVTSVAFSPDGRRIASGSWDETVRIWNSETGAALGGPLTGHRGEVMTVAFSPDGRWIASGSSDATVRIWDLETGAVLAGPLVGHNSVVTTVAFSPDGRWIASGSWDKTLRIWDPETGAALVGPLTGHRGEVMSVGFFPDGRRIASGSWDKTVRIWDSETGAALGVPLTGHTRGVTSVAFSPDGRRIASGSWDETVRIWDSETGASLGGPLTGHRGEVMTVAFSPDGRRIASGSSDATARIWEPEIGAPLAGPLTGHISGITSVALAPDGKWIASASWDETVGIWDSETGAALHVPLTGYSGGVMSVAVSPDGTRIASGSSDGTVRIWDSETGAALGGPLTGHRGEVMTVAFSPDGRRIASGSWDKTTRIWDAETGATLGGPLTGHTGGVTSVSFSPDGRRIASSSSDETVRIWDSDTGAVHVGPLTGHTNGVTSVAFSPDGKRIASGSWDETVRIWDSETGAAVGGPLTGHTSSVTSVAFAPDGRIASGSSDGTVRIWDSETGAALGGPLTGHTSDVSSVAFSPDGRQIASGSSDKTMRIWDSGIGRGKFENGWVIDSLDSRLFWVPAWLRDHLCLPWNSLVITPGGVPTLDLTTFVHGTHWQKCVK